MAVKDPWSVQQLVAATQQLDALRLYERLSDRDYFLIRTPKLDHPAVAMLLGHGGEAFGLNVFLGQNAWTTSHAILEAKVDSYAHLAMMRASMIGYQMCDARDLSHDGRRWLKKGRVKTRGRQWYPDPMSIEPGKVPVVLLGDGKTRLLLHLVRGILAAAQDKAFAPCGTDRRDRVLCLTLSQDAQNPTAEVSWEPVPTSGSTADTTESDSTKADASARMPFDLAGLGRTDDAWLLALIPMPGSVANDDRQPFVLVVWSQRSGNVWPSLLMGGTPQQIVDALSKLMRGEAESSHQAMSGTTPPPAGLPEQLVAASGDLHQIVHDVFEPLNIECINGEDDPTIQELVANMEQSFDMATAEADAYKSAPDDRVPAADDLEGWKRVDGWIKDEIFRGFDEDDRYFGARALNRYFGSDADPVHLMNTYRQLMCIDSYAHWFAISYRSTRKSMTLAEEWLADSETAEPVKMMLERMAATGPSIYRVIEADEDAGKITFEDVFTGELTVATDLSLSTCLDPGLMLPGKLVPVGAFYFFFPAGPVMSATHFNRAMEFFQDQGITPSPELFRDKPFLLGRLWDVIDQFSQQPVDMRNADGHALIPHTAIFTCTDRAALEQHLEGLVDFEREPGDADAWVWFREADHASRATGGSQAIETRFQGPSGARSVLGQVEIEGDRVALHTNSRERIDTARIIFDGVRGLEFVSLETHELSDSDRDPLPPRPAQPGPEETEMAEAYLAEHYRQWLDLPIPALNGKTPRQAAKRRKLRPRLIALIRSIPDITNPGDGRVIAAAPREMLLKELGLD